MVFLSDKHQFLHFKQLNFMISFTYKNNYFKRLRNKSTKINVKDK
jgi:hypothetical protein